MAFTDTDRIAKRIGDKAFNSLCDTDQDRITWTLEAVEQKLRLSPWNISISATAFTEYLSQGGRIVDDTDLADFSVANDGTIMPIDQETGSSVLQLRYTPVLEADLVIYEDQGAYAGESPTPFPSSTLLVKGLDYYLDCDMPGVSTSGRVHRVSGGWSRVPRSIKVTYKGGPKAAEDAALGADFLNVYQECVVSCVLHNFAFWKQQQNSHEAGNGGLIEKSESLGKYSHSLGNPMTSGSSGFMFGATPQLTPDELLTDLTPFVNVGALLCR